LRPVSVPGCLRAVGLMFGTKMVLDRYWLSLDGVNRNRTATMLIVQAPVAWRQSLARFYLCNFSAPCAHLLEIFGPLE